MTDLLEEPDDATPLTPDERKNLIPSDITYRHELNKAEQESITRAQDWAPSSRRNVMMERFLRALHRRMLGDEWAVAERCYFSAESMQQPTTPSLSSTAQEILAAIA